MAKGRKRKPTKILKLTKTYRKDQRPANEPKPKVGIPTAPTWLDATAKIEWRRIVKYLAELELVSHIDRTILALHCQALSDYIVAKKDVDKNGIVTETDKGNEIQYPGVGVMNKAWERVLKSAREFGMTPSARSSIHIAEKKDEDDPLKALRDRHRKNA